MTKGRVLIAGATGFVGQSVWPALEEAGFHVRGLTRHAANARRERPDADWAEGDVETGEGVAEALAGCAAALYLVHGMGRGDGRYRERDRKAAEGFARRAAEAGIGRIIYVGGVAPRGRPSKHLASRLEVGEILRGGATPCLELRASMIVGCGSLSWWIVRDLAARLPAMLMPRWTRHHTQPVAIRDVAEALTRGLGVPLEKSAWYDIPGPQTLTEKEIIVESARALGLRPPLMMGVPFVSPGLSSYWIHLITRADWSVAREIVLGLSEELVARTDDYWRLIGHTDLTTFQEAAREAVREEREKGLRLPPVAAWVEALMRALRSTRRAER